MHKSWRSEHTGGSLGRAKFSQGEIFLKGTEEEGAEGGPELKREEGMQRPHKPFYFFNCLFILVNLES